MAVPDLSKERIARPGGAGETVPVLDSGGRRGRTPHATRCAEGRKLRGWTGCRETLGSAVRGTPSEVHR